MFGKFLLEPSIVCTFIVKSNYFPFWINKSSSTYRVSISTYLLSSVYTFYMCIVYKICVKQTEDGGYVRTQIWNRMNLADVFDTVLSKHNIQNLLLLLFPPSVWLIVKLKVTFTQSSIVINCDTLCSRSPIQILYKIKNMTRLFSSNIVHLHFNTKILIISIIILELLRTIPSDCRKCCLCFAKFKN